MPQSEPRLIVEGWIDDKGAPVVIVSTDIPISSEMHDLSDIGQHLVRWAKVTVSDGEQTVILTGKVDRRYFPPYIYTTSEMEGQAGRGYTLTVDYHDFHASAFTTIPSPADLDSLCVRKRPDSDALYSIEAYFRDNPSERNYYKFFSCVGARSRMFLSSYIQTISDEMLNPGEEIQVSVLRGRTSPTITDYVPYYLKGDTVFVKFAQIDSVSYSVWSQLEHTATLSRLPISMSVKNPSFNVNGALGYWCGYGSRIYPVIVR